MNIEQYIEKNFDNTSYWFEQEVNRPYHAKRITDAINKVFYLKGMHKVKNREDAVYKGRELITRKTIINYAKTVIATVYKGNIIKINNGLPILRRDTAQTRLRAVFL